MKLPDAPWQKRDGMGHLLRALDSDGGATRFVGGSVRDTLLGLEVSDVDLATRLTPEEVIERLGRAKIKAVPTGLAHGTVTAVVGGAPVEVTTLRRDVSTDGRRATVAFTDDWREDAARRDFTINALSADPGTGEVFDYFGGLDDLKARRLRFIGDPLTRIAEDHLRILRFFRFHARFGEAPPDAAALEACTARANDLMALSRERIADELLKLLVLPDPSATVGLMVEQGILLPVLPEIAASSVERMKRLVAVERECNVAPEALRRLAALLPRDADLVSAVAMRLRLSKRALKRLVIAVGPIEQAPEQLAYKVGLEGAVDRLLLSELPVADLQEKLAALTGWERPRFLLSGGDFIAMGLEPGPVVAATLQASEQEWVRRGFPKDPEEMRRIAREHVERAARDTW